MGALRWPDTWPRDPLAALRHARHGRIGVEILPVAVLIIVFAGGVAAPAIAPHPPTTGDLAASVEPPVWEGGTVDHILGTDRVGRDVLSRLLFGARLSLSVAVLAIVLGASVGTALGAVAGFYGSWVDVVVMRAVEVTLALPIVLIALVFAVLFGPGITNLVVVLSLLMWARFARQLRAEALVLREQQYIALARVAGLSEWRILLRHIAPGLVNTLIVLATLQLGSVILLESSLSFLGVGLPPDQPGWGIMVADGLTNLMIGQWWLSAFPAAAISLTVISVNYVGDWLRDRLDPKLRALG